MIKIGKNLGKFSTYSCQPKTKKELEEIVGERMLFKGNNCDLNDIDISLIDDLSGLFYCSEFTGDISRWDTDYMFLECPIKKEFKPKLSRWSR